MNFECHTFYQLKNFVQCKRQKNDPFKKKKVCKLNKNNWEHFEMFGISFHMAFFSFVMEQPASIWTMFFLPTITFFLKCLDVVVRKLFSM